MFYFLYGSIILSGLWAAIGVTCSRLKLPILMKEWKGETTEGSKEKKYIWKIKNNLSSLNSHFTYLLSFPFLLFLLFCLLPSPTVLSHFLISFFSPSPPDQCGRRLSLHWRERQRRMPWLNWREGQTTWRIQGLLVCIHEYHVLCTC